MAVVDYRVSSPSLFLAGGQHAAACILISCGSDEGERTAGQDRMSWFLGGKKSHLIPQLVAHPRRLLLFHSIGGDRKDWQELSGMTGALAVFHQLFVSAFTPKSQVNVYWKCNLLTIVHLCMLAH